MHLVYCYRFIAETFAWFDLMIPLPVHYLVAKHHWRGVALS